MGKRLHVSLMSVPEVFAATLAGLYDLLKSFEGLTWFDEALPRTPPFEVDIVTEWPGPVHTASGLPFDGQRTLSEVPHTDIVVVPTTMVAGGRWETGRYPHAVEWMRAMHGRGAMLCAACSGTLLLAETRLLDGLDATMHWAFASTFHENFPQVRLRPEEPLIVTGDGGRLVMSGASNSWTDLGLYLITRHVGPAAAQAMAKFHVLETHSEGLAHYIPFHPPSRHPDGVVRRAQRWLADHHTDRDVITQVVQRSGLPERTFKRRFKQATGHSLLDYVQRLRIERAKAHLERGDLPIGEVGWAVGYEDPAFFRRLFKRIAGIPPGRYRRKVAVPAAG